MKSNSKLNQAVLAGAVLAMALGCLPLAADAQSAQEVPAGYGLGLLQFDQGVLKPEGHAGAADVVDAAAAPAAAENHASVIYPEDYADTPASHPAVISNVPVPSSPEEQMVFGRITKGAKEAWNSVIADPMIQAGWWLQAQPLISLGYLLKIY